jgi:lysophospholipase
MYFCKQQHFNHFGLFPTAFHFLLAKMFSSSQLVCAFLLASSLTVAAPTSHESVEAEPRLSLISPYLPIPALCPSTPLVRPATSIGSQEASYVSSRKTKASASLAAWLAKQGSFSTSSQPTVGLTSSGGGYRALLNTAGVVQGLDARDSKVGTSGLYQGLTYQAGLSGGSWFLSSLAGNNWPTVTSLKTSLWGPAFQNTLLLPANLFSSSGLSEYADIVEDLAEKDAAGYQVSVVDPYGRLLSYQLLLGSDGGGADRLSGITSLGNFTSYNAPYPIITASFNLGTEGQCYPSLSSPIFEFHPYEYGSWDSGVSAFAQSKYMGTDISNGDATELCTVHYDNLGYVFGTSSDVFNAICNVIVPENSTLAGLLEGIVSEIHPPAFNDQFGLYPNPFYNYPRSSLVQNESVLTLSDGGETDQNNPIWPFIQPERSVDVLIVNDNSADTSDDFPDGSEIRQTYIEAQAKGLTKMPFIPDATTFLAQGLNKRATFFGCNQTNTVFIVFLPNVNYTYPSNQPTSKIEYTIPETDGMIANGVAVATQNGAADWPFCLACAIKNTDGSSLPSGCAACFQKYCYHSQ